MPRIFSPTFRLAIAMAVLSVSLLLFGHALGLVPDESKAQIEARTKVSEALAIQLAGAAARNDLASVNMTVEAVVTRNKDILSLALRKTDGSILAVSGEHGSLWGDRTSKISTPTHVRVPLFDGATRWGNVEIVYSKLNSTGMFLGIPDAILALVALLGAFGLGLYYFLLSRALRELDPSNVVPERVQNAFDTLSEGVMILDDDDNILLSNTALSALAGQTSEALVGQKPTTLNWADGAQSEYPWQVAMHHGTQVRGMRMALRDPSGSTRTFMVNAACIRDGQGKAAGTIATFDDVTDLEQRNEDLRVAVHKLQLSEVEVKQRNEELEYMASHDALSGCLNRRAFFTKFEAMMELAFAGNRHLSCIMVDLDHFKSVNDRFGHGVGDDVIKGVAGVLRANCRGQDIAGRYGGEEFCGVCIDLDEEESRQLAEKIRTEIYEKSPAWFPTGEHATASIGLAMREGPYLPDATSTLTDQADQALYAAKEGGRNRVVLFSQMDQCVPLPENTLLPEAEPAAETVVEVEGSAVGWMEEHIRVALHNRQLMLYYQPIIAVETGRLIATEALLRCNSPALSDVPVQTLIEVAEQSGLIIELGEWVLATAIAQLQSWEAQGIYLPKMSINISGIQLSNLEITHRLVDVVRDSGVAPSRLQLEVTESARVENLEVACEVLSTLQSMGVNIALDDYGTGQASLVYLRLFTPNMLKIDRSFVSEIETNQADQVLVSSLITLAHSLNAKVTAEGVETAQQLDILREMNCDEAQGYGIAYPMPVDAATRWLELFAPQPSAEVQAPQDLARTA